jgi:hypothetical protein
MTPVTALAERKKRFAASMSRFSLSITSTSVPDRLIARYK